jgi:hypothetical protein
MAEKSSFILYFSYRKHLALLSDEECGKLLMALFDYAENGQAPDLTGATAMAFSFIQDQMERDASKYAAVCERNRKNGAKGGRPPKATKSEHNPEKPKITERLSEKPKKPDNEYEYEYEYDNENAITPQLPPAGDSVVPGLNIQEKRFNEFWSVYPKKVGKAAAKKSWARVKPNAELHSSIMKAVEAQKRSEQWQRENGRYIPNPATWLNQGRWDDEIGTGYPNTNIRSDPKTESGNGQERTYKLSGFKMSDGTDTWGAEK